MAKRIKQTNIDETASIADQVLDDKSSSETAPEAPVPQVQNDLQEQIDQLKKQNVQLLDEKSKMTDIVANYIAEADQHKEDIAKLAEKVETLQAKLDEANAAASQSCADELEGKIASLESEVASLKAANTELSKQNDGCLEKISELTFENAKLTSMLQETKQTSAEPAPPKRLANGPFNPYKNNGYSSWN